MPEINDISIHQLIVQWELDLAFLINDFEAAVKAGNDSDADELAGRSEELESCITELKQVLGLLP